MIVAEDILKVISDKQSLELLRIVALTKRDNNYNTDALMSKTKLTSEQYYSRMSTLSNAGLIKSNNGKHTLSAFGKVAFYALTMIENGVTNYWKLKTIDSLEMSNDLPAEERKKLIDNLLDNQEIKNILVPYNDNNNND
jgi:hypothetical protein